MVVSAVAGTTYQAHLHEATHLRGDLVGVHGCAGVVQGWRRPPVATVSEWPLPVPWGGSSSCNFSEEMFEIPPRAPCHIDVPGSRLDFLSRGFQHTSRGYIESARVRARSFFLSFGCGGKRVPRAFSGVVEHVGARRANDWICVWGAFCHPAFPNLEEARVLPRAKHKAPWTKMK